MRSMFGNLLKQVWLIARQVKSLKHPQYGAIRVVVKVLWTDSAVPQLQAIHDYVAQTSPDYAVRIVDRLTRRSIQIAAFPTSGRMVPEGNRYSHRFILFSRPLNLGSSLKGSINGSITILLK